MSVILLSDRSVLGTSDEHCALDVSSGRRITPVGLQSIPPKSAESPPGTPRSNAAQSRPSEGAPARETPAEAAPEVPASGYLPGSG